jgi:hypothetical protein
MKRTQIFITLLLSTWIFLGFDSYYSCLQQCGRVGLTRKNGHGCICHSDTPSLNVFVEIAGPDSLAPGESDTFMVAIFGGPDSSGGMNTAVNKGTLHKIDTTLCELDSELTYAFPHPHPIDGVIYWHFLYTAPLESGWDTMYAVGNSVNLNGLPTGDQWNFGENFPIKIGGAVAVNEPLQLPQEIKLFQNYPNPFNPKTIISFSLFAVSTVTMKVYDVSGKEIAVLVNNKKLEAGTHTAEFDATNLPSGVYIYKLQTENFSTERKMLLVK